MRYLLKETGYESWDELLDDYIDCKLINKGITWHNFYIGKKNSFESIRKVNKILEQKLDKIQDPDIFRS